MTEHVHKWVYYFLERDLARQCRICAEVEGVDVDGLEQQLQEARALLERCYLALAKREGFYLSLPEHPEAIAKAIRTFSKKEV